MKPQQKQSIAIVLVLAIAMAGCAKTVPGTVPGSTLAKVSKGLSIMASSLTAVQTTVIQAGNRGLISTQDVQTILSICQKINTAGQQASALIRAQSTMTGTTANQLLAILQQISGYIQQDLTNGTINIKDKTTQATIQGVIATIQTAIGASEIALSGSTTPPVAVTPGA